MDCLNAHESLLAVVNNTHFYIIYVLCPIVATLSVLYLGILCTDHVDIGSYLLLTLSSL